MAADWRASFRSLRRLIPSSFEAAPPWSSSARDGAILHQTAHAACRGPEIKPQRNRQRKHWFLQYCRVLLPKFALVSTPGATIPFVMDRKGWLDLCGLRAQVRIRRVLMQDVILKSGRGHNLVVIPFVLFLFSAFSGRNELFSRSGRKLKRPLPGGAWTRMGGPFWATRNGRPVRLQRRQR